MNKIAWLTTSTEIIQLNEITGRARADFCFGIKQSQVRLPSMPTATFCKRPPPSLAHSRKLNYYLPRRTLLMVKFIFENIHFAPKLATSEWWHEYHHHKPARL